MLEFLLYLNLDITATVPFHKANESSNKKHAATLHALYDNKCVLFDQCKKVVTLELSAREYWGDYSKTWHGLVTPRQGDYKLPERRPQIPLRSERLRFYFFAQMVV